MKMQGNFFEICFHGWNFSRWISNIIDIGMTSHIYYLLKNIIMNFETLILSFPSLITAISPSTGLTSTEDIATISAVTQTPDFNATTQENFTTEVNSTLTSTSVGSTTIPSPSTPYRCPDGAHCHNLGPECLDCQFNYHCLYGKDTSVNCTVKEGVRCIGSRDQTKDLECRYCYQQPQSNYTCSKVNATCAVKDAPRKRYTAACQVKENVFCLGSRTFQKSQFCNWTSGYKWSTALALSVTLGGFGVDRFYLGSGKKLWGNCSALGGWGYGPLLMLSWLLWDTLDQRTDLSISNAFFF